jgi:hypothetical protein
VQASPKKALHFSGFKSEHISLKYPLPNSPVLLLFLGTSAYHPQIANARWLVLTGIRSPVLAPISNCFLYQACQRIRNKEEKKR